MLVELELLVQVEQLVAQVPLVRVVPQVLQVQLVLQGQPELLVEQVPLVRQDFQGQIQALAERAEQPEQPELLVHLEQAVLPEQAQTIRGRVRTAQERRIQRINAYRITAQDTFAYLPELVNSLTSLLLTGMSSARQVRAEQLAQLVLQELQVRAELQVLQEPLELLVLVRAELLERVEHLVKLGLQVQLAVEVHQGQAVPREQAGHPVHLELEHLVLLEQ